MKIWIDGVDLNAIKIAKQMGLLYGVTTNPSLLANSNFSPSTAISKLLQEQKGPVAVQVTQSTPQAMIAQARKFVRFSERLIIKIPANQAGFEAMHVLKKEYIPIMATTILDAKQVLLSAHLGAEYVAPYLKSMDEMHTDYQSELKKMCAMLQSQKFKTKILAASIKNIDQILFCAEQGIDAVTLPSNLFFELINTHASVSEHLQKFADAWGNKEDALFAME